MMMRNHILLPAIASLLIGTALHAQAPAGNLNLTVNLDQLQYPAKKIFFTYYNTSTKFRYNDSAVIDAGKKITFTTHLDEPLLAQLFVEPAQPGGSKRDEYAVYIEPGKIEVTAQDSLQHATVTGSATHQDYLLLKQQLESYDAARAQLYTQYSHYRKAKDEAGIARITRAFDSLENLEGEQVYRKFAIEHGQTSPVALYALFQYGGFALDPAKVEPVFNRLGKNIQDLPAGKVFKSRIALAKTTQVGQYAPAFTQADTAGVPVSLSSFKGKYVLLDFWASWCGPCRAENPNVVKAFQEYHDKGFTVLGVSLDRPGQQEKWLKAIHDDHLTWTHVSDLAFWNNAVAKTYGILAIPQNYLIDRQGKIIARNIRGEALDKTLAEIFN